MKPTYKGTTKYPLYKSPPTKEELNICKFVPVRVWKFKYSELDEWVKSGKSSIE